MTQFGPFTLGIVALFLFLIISVSANQKKVPEEIVTKMSLVEYCNFFKKPFCSLPNNFDVVVIVVTTSDIDDTCAGKLIKKAKDEYGIEIFGVFKFEISSMSHTTWIRNYDKDGHQKYASQNDPAIYVTCSADFLIKK